MREVRVVDAADAVGEVVVKIEVEAFTHGVQTVKEVDAIQVHKVTVQSVAPLFRGLDGDGRVLAQFEDVITRDVHDAYVCQTVPFFVHFRTWRLTEEGGSVIKVSCEELFWAPVSVKVVKDGCWTKADSSAWGEWMGGNGLLDLMVLTVVCRLLQGIALANDPLEVEDREQDTEY
jgi:hypothetical protein